MIADLVLGRRQHPLFDLHYDNVTEVPLNHAFSYLNDPLKMTRMTFDFIVENLSLVTAERVEIGVVSWSLIGDDVEINRHLRAYIDIVETPSGRLKTHVVHRTGEGGENLGPFKKYLVTIGPFDFVHGLLSPIFCAVYVICKGSPPTWFQLRYLHAAGTGQESQVTLTPMGTERPKVAWT